MTDNMKDNILNTGGDPPGTGGIDFSKMSDEEADENGHIRHFS